MVKFRRLLTKLLCIPTTIRIKLHSYKEKKLVDIEYIFLYCTTNL